MTMLVLLAIGGGAWMEQTEQRVWQERLVLPSYGQEENRHTPIHFAGTFLPPVIDTSRTYTAQDNPIIIPGKVSVPVGVTLTFSEGAFIVVHEYGHLDIEGSLVVNGTMQDRVVFTTNEAHAANRAWSGFHFQPASTGRISEATIIHASPGVTCEIGSAVDIRVATIELGNVGAYVASPHCTIIDSLIQKVDIGIIAADIKPRVFNTTIRARKEEVREGTRTPLFE